MRYAMVTWQTIIHALLNQTQNDQYVLYLWDYSGVAHFANDDTTEHFSVQSCVSLFSFPNFQVSTMLHIQFCQHYKHTKVIDKDGASLTKFIHSLVYSEKSCRLLASMTLLWGVPDEVTKVLRQLSSRQVRQWLTTKVLIIYSPNPCVS